MPFSVKFESLYRVLRNFITNIACKKFLFVFAIILGIGSVINWKIKNHFVCAYIFEVFLSKTSILEIQNCIKFELFFFGFGQM